STARPARRRRHEGQSRCQLPADGPHAAASASTTAQDRPVARADRDADRDQPIEITGTVTKVEWMNTHARICVDAPDTDGLVANWNLELGSSNGLMRQGRRRNS